MSHHHNELGQPIGAAVPEWRARPFPPRFPLSGHFCRLEPLDPDRHAEALFRANAAEVDARHWTYLSYGPFPSLAAYRAWMDETCSGDDLQFYAIVTPPPQQNERAPATQHKQASAPQNKSDGAATDGQALGIASYLRIEPAIGVIEVGHIHFAPALQRTAAATEAMYLMMRRVFEELGYRRYEWKCDALNERSRRAATRLGFSFEGVFRQATMYKGRNRDTAWYAILDEEWPALKTAYETWLDPASFDAQGRQQLSLGELIAQARA